MQRRVKWLRERPAADNHCNTSDSHGQPDHAWPYAGSLWHAAANVLVSMRHLRMNPDRVSYNIVVSAAQKAGGLITCAGGSAMQCRRTV